MFFQLKSDESIKKSLKNVKAWHNIALIGLEYWDKDEKILY